VSKVAKSPNTVLQQGGLSTSKKQKQNGHLGPWPKGKREKTDRRAVLKDMLEAARGASTGLYTKVLGGQKRLLMDG